MPKVPERRLAAEEIAELEAQEWWTVQETADWLRVGPGFIRTAIRRGAIPCFRAGTWMRIPRRQLMEAMESGALAMEVPDSDIVRLPL